MQTVNPSNLTHPAQFRVPRGLQRLVRWVAIFAAFLALSLLVYNLLVWPWISRWGATNEEVTGALPGDELIPNPIVTTTKAVTVNAAPEQIWPWLAQLGVDRGGMYSYLWVENGLMRLNVANAETVNPAWQKLDVGDFIRFTPKDYPMNPGPGLYVLLVEPGHIVAGCFGVENAPVDCNHASTWQFVLEPQGADSTRLILRSRSAGMPTATSIIATEVGGAFVFLMERKMLLTLKERAESSDTPELVPRQ